MFTVTIQTKDQCFTQKYEQEVLAAQALSDAGIVQSKPCGGRGVCGKCTIRLNGREVLSCKTMIDSDSTIDYTTAVHDVQGITAGIMRHFPKNPLVQEGFGAAIDIGTTTIAGYIYRFPACELVKTACVPNTQSEFGADVISRIDCFAAGGAEKLFRRVHEAIRELTEGFPIQKYVICGNTAMLHLLTKTNPSSLAVAPYVAETLFGAWRENAYLMRCISAFVGADTVAAALASGMMEQQTGLLIDIGTNGEMVLKHGEKLLCCSTAAGPCFEGAGISCGTPAVSGAIGQAFVKENALSFTTIDARPPVGICGTGLVDAVAALLQLGVIDESGYMENAFYFGASSVYLSPEDVRKFQLAKSAVRAGMETLLHAAEVRYEDIDAFYIAGGFGSFLNIKSAVATGLIPAALEEKAVSIGNGAGIGAAEVLQSKQCLSLSEKIAAQAETLTLTDNPYFADQYIENMMFEVTP